MANQENTRTQKQDLNQHQPPQQDQQGDGNKNAGQNAGERGRLPEQARRMAPGQSARQPESKGGTRH